MTKKLIILGALLFAFLLLVGSATAKDKDYEGETVNWTISQSQVTDYGETTDSEEGILTMNYTVEGMAESPDAPITDGLFRAKVTVFTPKKEKPGQKPGIWYLKAKWEILDKNATKEKLKEKHNEYLMKGFLTAELPFNPAESQGDVNARADFPLYLVGKYWGEALGGFNGNEIFEGNLNLTFSRWQKVKDK